MEHQEPASLAPAATPSISIAGLERATGIGKDTLRVWERRYGFPQPVRDANGERTYPQEQVDKLRVVRRLIDAGHRPGKIVALSLSELTLLSQALQQRTASSNGAMPSDSSDLSQGEDNSLDAYVTLIKTHDLDELRRHLAQTLRQLGLARFVQDVVAPLNGMVGDAWLRGALETYEEHFYTEAIQTVLRSAITDVAPPTGNAHAPRILLTTVPFEAHGLGLLMAEALFALEGCKCISLGTQTPISDIVRAASTQRADIVALSFTASLAPNVVLDSLAELRAQLPAAVQIWTGGACPVLQRKTFEGITTLAGLAAMPAAVARWRQALHD